jgi:hypothetical protein
MIKRTLLTAMVCLLAAARAASAHPTTECAPPPSEPVPAPTLQQILDGLVVSGPAIDAGAPQNIALWQNAAGPMTATFVADYTPRADGIWFGMYDADHPGNPAFLLSDVITPADVATVSFNDDGSISVTGGLKPKSLGFDGPFGFFAKNFAPDDSRPSVFLFTEADLNGDGVRAKVFQGNGTTMLKIPGLAPGLFLESQYLIAFETGLGENNDHGFNDFLVLISSAVPAPEPALAWLFALSSLAVLVGRRSCSP